DNVVEGLTALLICIEMVPFAAAFLWSFPARVYKRRADTPRTPVRRAFMDTLNFADFFREAWYLLQWVAVPFTHRRPQEPHVDKNRFFRVDSNGEYGHAAAGSPIPLQQTALASQPPPPAALLGSLPRRT
ncbi:hypothetical protein IWQ57_005244, partial [Coemansia nantahalensis]